MEEIYNKDVAIFLSGIVVGGFFLAIFNWFEEFLHRHLNIKQLERIKMLGEAVEKMQERIKKS